MKAYLSSYRLGNKPEYFKSFLAAGDKVAVVANACDHKTPQERLERVNIEIESIKSLGLHSEEIDLRNFYTKPITTKDIEPYKAIWIRGGNVFNLARSIKKSGFDLVLKKLLTQDRLVYGGYSAGACILSKSLHGIELCDPIDVIPEGLSEEIVWEGLGLLDYAIAPHYKSDHYESDSIDEVIKYMVENNMPYKTLRDGEAIVINGSEEKKVG